MISIDTLASALIPSEQATLLLRTAFLAGEEAGSDLSRWQRQEENPSRAVAAPETVSLAPTLFANVQGWPTRDLDSRFATYLKTALVHEQRRLEAYRSILGEALHELRHLRPHFLLTGGALNGETLYPQGIRHSHDIDLLVRPSDRAAVANALAKAGFAAAPPTHERSRLTFLHAKGLPVSLHARALMFRAYDLDCEGVFARAETYEVLGHAIEGPGREDRFLQACVNGIASFRRGVLWVGDAVLLSRQKDIDGRTLVTASQAANCGLALLIALRYLEIRLALAGARPGVRLTAEDRRLLDVAANASVATASEILLQGSWSGERGSLRQHLDRCASRGEKLFVLKAKILPSLEALTGSNRLEGPGELPGFYWGRARRLLNRALRAKTSTSPSSEPR